MGKKKEGCVFCDSGNPLICHSGKDFFVILNKYPYTGGHLMIVPHKHVSSPDEITPEQSMEMWSLANRAMAILKKEFNPAGFNLGMNLGKIAGAGIKDHIHLHIVPRWEGDANFMPIIGETKVASYKLDAILEILIKEFKE